MINRGRAFCPFMRAIVAAQKGGQKDEKIHEISWYDGDDWADGSRLRKQQRAGASAYAEL